MLLAIACLQYSAATGDAVAWQLFFFVTWQGFSVDSGPEAHRGTRTTLGAHYGGTDDPAVIAPNGLALRLLPGPKMGAREMPLFCTSYNW